MQVMEKLVEVGVVTIHIPDIVKREFLTKRVSDVTNACNSIRVNVLKGLKKLDNGIELKNRMLALETEIVQLNGLVEKSLNEDLELWVDTHDSPA